MRFHLFLYSGAIKTINSQSFSHKANGTEMSEKMQKKDIYSEYSLLFTHFMILFALYSPQKCKIHTLHFSFLLPLCLYCLFDKMLHTTRKKKKKRSKVTVICQVLRDM